MARIAIRGWLLSDSGLAIPSRLVEAYVSGTVTPAATTSTDSNGQWAFPSLAEATYDVKQEAMGRARWLRGGRQEQVSELQVADLLNLGAVASVSGLGAAHLPTHDHTAAGQGGDYPWADITGFGPEPGTVSSSTSGQAGTATTAARGDHNHDLGTHAHSGATDGGALAASVLPSHAHTSATTGGDFPWGDITGFGLEPGAVSSSTSGQEGASLTVSRGDHNHDLGQHAHAAAASGGQIAYSALTGTPTLADGTYTPVLTNVANLDASTAYVCQYLRVGSVVTVSGVVAVNPTTGGGTITQLGISLPIASDFASDVQCGGVAAAIAYQESAGIYADLTNNRAEMYWPTSQTANFTMRFTFTYLVV